MFNLQKFSSNKIPATKAHVLVDKLRMDYVGKIIREKKISKDTYLDLNKKNLYVISEINNMFSSSKYKYLNILSYLLKSSVPIHNIPIGLVSGYLTHNPLAVLETIGNASSNEDYVTLYKNFRHPDFFESQFIPNTEKQNKNDLKNVLESMPVEWINLSLKGTNIVGLVKIMCDTKYDFSKIHKTAIKSLKSNKNISDVIKNCNELRGFLSTKK